MRRKDREITDNSVIDSFIKSCNILRIGFYDAGDIYIVPVNYGYEYRDNKRIFYFHGAKAGRKYELSKTSPDVGFEIDGDFKLIEGETACGHSAKFQSVIGSGKLSLIENNNDKLAALNCLMHQLTGKDNYTYSDKTLSATAVFRLEVSKLSCKAK